MMIKKEPVQVINIIVEVREHPDQGIGVKYVLRST
jgi:hypothetical protein